MGSREPKTLDPRVVAWATRRRLKGLSDSLGVSVQSLLDTPARTVEAWLVCEELFADWMKPNGS